jgi:hypothetical protein
VGRSGREPGDMIQCLPGYQQRPKRTALRFKVKAVNNRGTL